MSLLSVLESRSLLFLSVLFLLGSTIFILNQTSLSKELGQAAGLSPFYDDRFSLSLGTSGKNSLVIHVSPSLRSSVNISGWKISQNDKEIALPLVVRSPLYGSVNTFEPFVVSPGETILIEGGSSPLGYSFLSNKCAGFLDEFLSFNPSLGGSACPNPKSSGAPDHSCQVLLESLPSCRSNLSILPPGTTRSCRAFIADRASYNHCVANHKNDPDFYSAEWRVYLEDFTILNSGTVTLLDNEGREISSLSLP